MSPEQALGNKSIDHRADLWSLGVIAFECICGVRPFDSEALGELIVQICARPLPIPSDAVAMSGVPLPDGFDAWFAKACAREPQDRFQSARELAESLRFLLSPEGSGLISLGMTGTSMPRIVVPHQERISLLGLDGANMLRPPFPNANTLTHPGVAAAVTSGAGTSKSRRSAVIVGFVATLVVAAVAAGVLVTAGGASTTDPSPAESGATPTATATPTPSASDTTAPAASVDASASASASSTSDTPDTPDAPSATATAKPIYTRPLTTKKTTNTKKKDGWGF
jgi:serine/threonine-protein kinase